MNRRLLIDFSLVDGGGARTYARGFTRELAEAAPRLRRSGIDICVLLNCGELAGASARLDAAGCMTVLVNGPRAGTWRSRAFEQCIVPFWAHRFGATDVFVPREVAPILGGNRTVVLARNLLYWESRVAQDHVSSTGLQIALGRWAAERGVANARGVIAPTRWLASHLPRSDATIVAHGSDIELIERSEKRECWLAGAGRLEVVTIGAICRHKHFDRAISIVDELSRQGIDVRVSMWGSAPDRELLEHLRAIALRSLGYDPFRGALPFERREEVFRTSDVLVLSSSRESFGYPLVEALRTSTVVVAPESPLVDELCCGSAITFDERNPKSAAVKVANALSDFGTIADAGRAIGESYSWKVCVEQTLKAVLGTAHNAWASTPQ